MERAPPEPSSPEFVKRHRVHFTVEPEWLGRGGPRASAGFTLRLFAVHEKGARALPACSKSRALAGSLRLLARAILPRCERDAVDVAPFSPVLYDSKEVPGADEVAVSIRLSPFASEPGSLRDSSTACLGSMRHALKVLGALER